MLVRQERARTLVTKEASVACVAAYWLQVIQLYSAEQTRINFTVQRLPSDEYIPTVPLSSPRSKAAGTESLEDSADRLIYNATFVDIKHRLMRVRCWAPGRPGNLTRSRTQVDVSGTNRSLFSRIASWFMPPHDRAQLLGHGEAAQKVEISKVGVLNWFWVTHWCV